MRLQNPEKLIETSIYPRLGILHIHIARFFSQHGSQKKKGTKAHKTQTQEEGRSTLKARG
jgi:hypothetical protein